MNPSSCDTNRGHIFTGGGYAVGRFEMLEARGRNLRRRMIELLRSNDLSAALSALREMGARRGVNVLLALLVNPDERVRWHSVTALGQLVPDVAMEDMESARNIMRRLMWSLNEESGGIGWGAPEAMGEIMARHDTLAHEYAHILVSYIRKDGNFLEYEPLQRGVVWGLGRVAQVKPDLLRSLGAAKHLIPLLKSSDASVCGLTAWTLGLLDATEARSGLEDLLPGSASIDLYTNGQMRSRRVGDIARESLQRMLG